MIACEFSGVVRDAFIRAGHSATSCDMRPTEAPGPHIVGDVLEVLNGGGRWDLMIAHPPCTFLCSSGLHWNKRRPGRAARTDEAVAFAAALLAADIPRIALENPIGCLSSRIRKPEQIIQPYEFGEDASKRTCLWLKGLPRLTGTRRFPGRWVEWPKGSGTLVERWSNQTDSGQNKLGPSEEREKQRSVTYAGIAEAMANQWGSFRGGSQ